MRTAARFLFGCAMIIGWAGIAVADGAWCRQEGGRIVDVIKLTRTAQGVAATFHEGQGAPAYAEGAGTLRNNILSLAVYNKGAKATIFVDGVVEGSILRYRSFNLDGGLRWEGSFQACK